jgi:hypothetical protein
MDWRVSLSEKVVQNRLIKPVDKDALSAILGPKPVTTVVPKAFQFPLLLDMSEPLAVKYSPMPIKIPLEKAKDKGDVAKKDENEEKPKGPIDLKDAETLGMREHKPELKTPFDRRLKQLLDESDYCGCKTPHKSLAMEPVTAKEVRLMMYKAELKPLIKLDGYPVGNWRNLYGEFKDKAKKDPQGTVESFRRIIGFSSLPQSEYPYAMYKIQHHRLDSEEKMAKELKGFYESCKDGKAKLDEKSVTLNATLVADLEKRYKRASADYDVAVLARKETDKAFAKDSFIADKSIAANKKANEAFYEKLRLQSLKSNVGFMVRNPKLTGQLAKMQTDDCTRKLGEIPKAHLRLKGEGDKVFSALNKEEKLMFAIMKPDFKVKEMSAVDSKTVVALMDREILRRVKIAEGRIERINGRIDKVNADKETDLVLPKDRLKTQWPKNTMVVSSSDQENLAYGGNDGNLYHIEALKLWDEGGSLTQALVKASEFGWFNKENHAYMTPVISQKRVEAFDPDIQRPRRVLIICGVTMGEDEENRFTDGADIFRAKMLEKFDKGRHALRREDVVILNKPTLKEIEKATDRLKASGGKDTELTVILLGHSESHKNYSDGLSDAEHELQGSRHGTFYLNGREFIDKDFLKGQLAKLSHFRSILFLTGGCMGGAWVAKADKLPERETLVDRSLQVVNT